MEKLRFEKTDFGYRVYRITSNKCYVYFGHYLTQKEAKRCYAEFLAGQYDDEDQEYMIFR